MTPEDRLALLAAISLDHEKVLGYDSIPTILRVYPTTSRGAYVCVWPQCDFARHDVVKLWKHVHTAHGTDSLPELPADVLPL